MSDQGSEIRLPQWMEFKRRNARVLSLIFPALIALSTLAVDLWIITHESVIYWYDPYMRLAYRDQISLGPWLPALQSILFLLTRFTTNLMVVRAALALIAAGATAACYWMVAQQVGVPAGILAAALLASNRMFVALSTVPYTEVLFIAALMFGLYFHDRPPTRATRVMAIICFNLACLTRYEAWIVVLFLIGESAVQANRAASRSVRSVLSAAVKQAAAYAGLPILWAALGGVAFYANEAATYAAFGQTVVLQSVSDFAEMIRWQAGEPILIAAAVGIVLAFTSRILRTMTLRLIGLAVLTFPVEILINPGNLRQPFIVLVVSLIYAAYAADRLIAWGVGLAVKYLHHAGTAAVVRSALPAALAAVISVTGLQTSLTFVHGAANERELVTAYRVGLWIKARSEPHDQVYVLAPNPGTPFMVSVYSEIPIDQIGGPEELKQIARQDARLGCVVIADMASRESENISRIRADFPNAIGKPPQVQITAVEDATVWVIC